MRVLDPAARESIEAVISRHRAELERCRGFLTARAGFPIVSGRLLREPAILVFVRSKVESLDLEPGETVPRQIESVRVDVQQADPIEQIELLPETAALAGELAAAAAQAPTYVGVPGDPIDTTFEVSKPFLCHAGPDTGWAVFRDFIAATRNDLVCAIYDFNADYIANAMIAMSLDAGAPIRLTIDDGLSAEEERIQDRLRDKLGDSYEADVVFCTGGARFPSAYHEKVVVRDGRSFWLSSGNWSKRSQPAIDPIGDPATAAGMYGKGNREWHIIVDDEPLSELFARYILHDRDQARADAALGHVARPPLPDLLVPVDAWFADLQDAALAAPVPVAPERLPAEPRDVRVRPLLSPDNYARRVTELIRDAQRSLYLQYSYITWSSKPQDEPFRELLEYLGELSWREDFDLRVIVGSRDAAARVRVLAENGWNEGVVRGQSNIHNKAVVADGERALVSSQNWSGDGFLRNRDAGLIVEDREVARYYQRIFLDDWEMRARSPFAGLAAVIAPPGGETPAGMVRVSWREYYGD